MTSINSEDNTLAIETINLNYEFANHRVGLTDINLEIPWGTTNLLVGPNGAGKSTLLKILAGKSLIKKGSLKLGGFDPFEFSSDRHTHRNSDINSYITYLGTEWAANSIVKRDIPVKILIASVGGDVYSERRDELIDILDIDCDWSMQQISDGERRRVQICMGLIKPWRLLLLDEVTIDLDVIVRSKLLEYLKRECALRRCSVVYATHIFDGLGKQWCDRVIHLDEGKKKDDIVISQIRYVVAKTEDEKRVKIDNQAVSVPLAETLHPLALHWLAGDLLERGSREEQRLRMEHARKGWDNERDGRYFDADSAKLSSYFISTRSKPGPS